MVSFDDLIPQQNKNPLQGKTFATLTDEDRAKIRAGIDPQARLVLEQALGGATFNLADEVYNRLGALGAYGYQALTDMPTQSQDPRLYGVNLGAFGRGANSLQELTNLASQETNKRLAEQLLEQPVLSIGSNIAGALLTGGAGVATKGGKALVNSLRSGNLAMRVGKASLLGAASGGLAGAGAGSGAEDRLERAGNAAVVGGVVGGAIPVVGSVANSAIKGAKNAGIGMGARGRDALAESGAELKDAVSSSYKKVDEAGAVINPEAANELLTGIKSNLAKIELIPELNPKTLGVVRYIEDAASKAPLKVTQIDQYRRLLSGIKDEDSVAASAARKGIDDFLSALDETKLSGGDANVGKYLLDARAAASQNFRFSKVAEILTRADGDPNKIKSGLTALLNKKGATAGWSADEVAALREAASSSTPEKLLKMGGKFGIDLGTSLTTGNTVAPLVGALAGGVGGGVGTAGVVPILGTAARYGQKLAARGKAEKLLQTIEGVAEKGGLPSLIGSRNAGQLALPAGSLATIPERQPTQIRVNPNQPNPYGKELPAVNLPRLDFNDLIPPQPPQQQQFAPQSSLQERIKNAESSGNPNAKNPRTSASGLYQFTDGTWRSVVDKFGRRSGIKYSDKNSPQAQEQMMAALLQDNARILQNKGIEANDANLYFAHFMGAPAASKAISMLGKNAIAARSFPEAAKKNPEVFFDGRRPRTVDEVYQIITSKVV
jgi:hypothetical protein